MNAREPKWRRIKLLVRLLGVMDLPQRGWWVCHSQARTPLPPRPCLRLGRRPSTKPSSCPEPANKEQCAPQPLLTNKHLPALMPIYAQASEDDIILALSAVPVLRKAVSD